jgi:hypothetical protein
VLLLLVSGARVADKKRRGTNGYCDAMSPFLPHRISEASISIQFSE